MNGPSRSEKKRQYKQVEATARECAELGGAELGELPLSEQVKEELGECRRLKGGALKRQVKYVTKLMQQEDLDPVLAFLSNRRGSRLEENRFQHEAERLRDSIINDAIESYREFSQAEASWPLDWPSGPIADLLELYPDIDEREVRVTAHNYARSRNKAHYRELFRIIRGAAEKQRLLYR